MHSVASHSSFYVRTGAVGVLAFGRAVLFPFVPCGCAAHTHTDRERAALAWTEALTLISENGVPDELYEDAKEQFTEKELVDLTLAVVAINGWNRLAISFRPPVGDYQPAAALAGR